jgi:hypothetical protein
VRWRGAGRGVGDEGGRRLMVSGRWRRGGCRGRGRTSARGVSHKRRRSL